MDPLIESSASGQDNHLPEPSEHLVLSPRANNEPHKMCRYITPRGQYHYFTFSHEIGKGHYGQVYMGYSESEKNVRQAVAVKTFNKNVGSIPNYHRNELKIMNELCHPNIVEVKGYWHDSDSSFGIVMEYLELGALKNYLQFEGHKITTQRRIKYTFDIATAMDYVAAKKIVHRDLAARNILVKDQDTVKIADFGLSRLLPDAEHDYQLQSARLLPMGWYAPEAAKPPYRFSTKSDVWSFGVTVWEIFSGQDVPDLSNRRDEDRASSFTHPDGCPTEVYEHLMKSCWQLDPQKRPSFLDLSRVSSNLLATKRDATT
ncbi:hypothetical protein JYU34_014299 [Plutella xylostella]|nr:hypothetical protein JYU34_014299 [Plutella xylostella]